MCENISIAWTNLTVSVGTFFAKNKIILDNISGSFRFNEINALMGSSGCGKTTLLKCFNGSNKYCFTDESNIWVQKDIGIRKCFIYQNHDQRVMTGLTVGQALTYASKLKNSTESNVNHKQIVSQVMSDLLISNIENNLIEKCSGGQIKRICIGLELTAVHKPNIILMDEPTTGLDSYAAEVLIKSLRDLCRTYHISIITSIHQPNHDLFEMFDSVYVLSKRGVCLYSGQPENLRKTLIDNQIECNENQIPIEILIKLSFDDTTNAINQLKDKTIESKTRFEFKTLKKTTNGTKNGTKVFKIIDTLYLLSRFLNRDYITNWKSLIKSILTFIFIQLFFVLTMNSEVTSADGCAQINVISNLTCAEKEDEKDLLAQTQNFIFFMGYFNTIILLVFEMSSFIRDIKIFQSEHQNRWYSYGSFWLAKHLADSILTLIFAIIIVIITQIFRPLVDDYYRFGLFFYVIFMTMMITKCLASIYGISLPNNNFALMTALFVSTILLLYSNLFFRITSLNEFLQIFSQFNYYKYYINGLLIIFYGMNRCSEEYQSKVLIEFDIEDDETLFWDYFHYFIISYIILMIIEIVLFNIKSKRIGFIKIFNTFMNFTSDTNLKLFNGYNPGLNIELDSYNKNDENFEQNRNTVILWNDLSFSIQKNFLWWNSNGKLQLILNQISGNFQTNTLNAIMGPSGSGKTTLLKCLNGNHFNGLTEESRIFISKPNLKTSFINQDIYEHLLQGLEVRQTLLYASKLKNLRIIGKLNHKLIVEDLMSELLISDISDNRVESCSCGEQKRIVIASELTSVNRPDILFIDEPTSGLDSNAAEVVVQCLKRLSRCHQMTIIVSIHQPNQDIFHMFDSIYVMAKGGLCVLADKPQNLKQHLSDCRIEINENQIPIEILLKVASNETQDKEINALKIKTREKQKHLFNESLNCCNHLMTGSTKLSKRFSFKDFRYLLIRTMTYIYKSQWKAFLMYFLAMIAQAINCVLHFDPQMVEPDGCFQIEFSVGCNQTLEEINDEYLLKTNFKCNFVLLVGVAYITQVLTSITFCTDFKVFRTEHKNGWYSTGSFLLTRTIVDMVPQFLFIAIYAAIINYYDWKIYLVLFTINYLLVICSQSMAQIGSILYSNNVKQSFLVTTLLFITMLMLSNSWIKYKELHYSLQILSTISYIKYGFQVFVIAVYGFNRCSEDEISLVLMSYGIETQDFGPNVITLITICCLFKLIVFLTLILKTNFQSLEKQKPIECREFDSSTKGNIL